MKVVTVVGTRPEIIRLSRVIPLLDRTLDHYLVHTGQNFDYNLNTIFFEELGLRQPKFTLTAGGVGKSTAATISDVISGTDKILARVKPDALLVLGDTNSCMAALAAKKRKIPVFHLEAGNRSFDERVPEELNRRLVDHLSDINLTYSSIAREYLLREGFSADRVIKVGSPMLEVLRYYKENIFNSRICESLKIEKRKYFLVSVHRDENIGNEISAKKTATILNNVAKKFRMPVIVTTHPKTRSAFDALGLCFEENIKLCDPVGFFDYIHLQMNARAVLSDSGTISEEASILGFPAINMREAHERPEGMEESVTIMSGLSWENIEQGISFFDHHRNLVQENFISSVRDYNVPNFSEKVVKIILSYTDYVNRIVWRKYD